MTAPTLRDSEILAALCTKVRLFTLGQIARTWWAETKDAEAAARRRLSKLAEGELVQRQRVLAAPLPLLEAPVMAWRPGQAVPDCGAAAWLLQSRWTRGPRATSVYTATRLATRRYGGSAASKMKATFQATHDLGVSQMYLNLLTNKPEQAELWVSEDTLAPYRRKQKLPDAVLAKRAGDRPQLVLEFGGQYDKRRVLAFHQDCEQRKLPYEVW